MAAIKVNGETIRPEDLCLGSDNDHQSLIEYWSIHEIEDCCDDEDQCKRLMDLINAFSRSPQSTSLTFSADVEGEHRTFIIKKI